MKLTPKRRELIAAVREHASKNYSRGWDVVIECYDDRSIAEVIGRARTAKGAIAKFAPMIDVRVDRQAEADYQIEQAVGMPLFGREHYRTGSEFSYDAPGCGCGAMYATDKAADLHVAAMRKTDGSYDRQAQGHHPDGSFVSWRHDEHSGDAWATRTWEGKSCRASIEIVETEAGYETVESYRPSWSGQHLFTADYCGHVEANSGNFWGCQGEHCNTKVHAGCEPPF